MSALPQHCPTRRERDDLDLLTSGAAAPTRMFNEPGSSLTLDLPRPLLDHLEQGGAVALIDPDGTPIAQVTAAPGGLAIDALADDARVRPFRRLYLTPAEVRAQHAGRTHVLVGGPLTEPQVARLRGLGPLVLMALVGGGVASLSPVALLRECLRVADSLDAVVVAVPLAARDERDRSMRAAVVQAYAGRDRVLDLTDDEDLEPAPSPRRGLVVYVAGEAAEESADLARAVTERLMEHDGREVTLLRSDSTEQSVRWLAWAAGEIGRHAGTAVCGPMPPTGAAQDAARAIVGDAGSSFFSVLRSDDGAAMPQLRTDLQASSTAWSAEEAAERVLDALQMAGHLEPPTTSNELAAAPTPVMPPAAYVPHRATPRPLSVLFVCTANICRSPYMELRARMLAGDDATIEFASAGIKGFDRHPVDETMAQVMRSRGIAPELISGFASQRLTESMVAAADLVLTAEASHRQALLEVVPGAFRKAFSLGQFVDSVARLSPDLAGRDLLTAVGGRRVGATDAQDIADPYRRGKKAAENAAHQIDGYLELTLARLRTR